MSTRILIVEDNESFATAIENLLRGKGYEPERAGDGITALQKILAAPPALILLDLQLPGLHGIELLRKLRAAPKTQGLPVVVMSGVYKGDRYVQAAQALGVKSYLEKPFPAPALLAAIETTLGAQAATPPASPPPPAKAPPTGFDRLLTRAFLNRFSGQLQLRDGETTRTLTFANGSPIALRPGFRSRDFGDYLQRQGVISTEEYRYYSQAGAYRHDLLVQMGCLRFGELQQRKLNYLADELIEAFTRPPMSAEETPLPIPEGLQAISVNLPQVIYDGYSRLLPPGRGGRFLGQVADRFAAPTPAYYEMINALTLNDEERQCLPRLDGTKALKEIVEGREGLAPLLCTLQALGMIRLAPAAIEPAPPPPWPIRAFFNAFEEELEISLPDEAMESFSDLVDLSAMESPIPETPPPTAAPAPAADSSIGEKVRATRDRLEGKNYYEVFGLSQGNFSFERLKESYFAITREFGPDILMQLGGEEAGMVEEILSTVTNAYNTLSDVIKKENYDLLLGADKVGLGQKGDDRFQAQVQSQSAKVFIDMEEWDNAEKALQDACGIDPNNGDYLAHLAWAIYRNPKYASSRATLDKARQMLNRALTLDRTAAGFAFKGWMLAESGQENLAESEFNKALKLDARNMLARKGLKLIMEKREQQKKGLFGRMFGG